MFDYIYSIVNLKDEKRLRSILSELYGFNPMAIKIETYYDKHSQRPYYLDNKNHYILFKVKELFLLSVDGELEILGKEG